MCRGQRTLAEFSSLLSPRGFWNQTQARLAGKWQVSFYPPPLLLAQHLDFDLNAKDLNSSLQACSAIALSTEPSPPTPGPLARAVL